MISGSSQRFMSVGVLVTVPWTVFSMVTILIVAIAAGTLTGVPSDANVKLPRYSEQAISGRPV